MTSHVILVVDDEPAVRMIVAETLRDAGFDVLEAGDASGALEVLRTEAGVELMCTDVQMPGALDGVELARVVKTQFPKVRIILTSGFSPKNLCLTGAPFLSKPFFPSELVALVRAQLRGSAGAESHAFQSAGTPL